MKKLALLSVSDKSNITTLAARLSKLGYDIIATGNTAKVIQDEGIKVTKIESFASFPEVFGGRVKTLQPKVFGGILMRRNNDSDIKEAEENGVLPIDIVCVNLYPFPKVVNRTDIDTQTKIENIDIGGPSLIRAATKNHKFVSVLTSPDQYEDFLNEIESGEISLGTRQKLAYEAFAHTSYYDTLIANFFESEFNQPRKDLRINVPLKSELRYGENPHQKAFVYGNFEDYFEILHGKELSFNNIVDLTAASELVNDFDETACSIIKHTNPCGAALADSVYQAYEYALSCDPVSAFGGVVAFNRKIDMQTAVKLNEIFLEIIVAPDYEDDALEILKKKKNRRLLKSIKELDRKSYQVRSLPGGYLAQEQDFSHLTKENLKVVTKKSYTEYELRNLKFAWVVCKHTKSNAIVYAKDLKAIGVGAGQMSRIDSAKIAASKAKEFGHDLKDSVAASDAFFPFPDGVELIAEQGATAIIQPGGSVRDEEVINKADEKNITMLFTGIRNFKH
ncbi:MAG: bifunctional phosphoribosylaminoimidazolecarboxamide formyltransferase/IMP cyclohydrolase [Melioribacteraceae bacterium]|nr:MAG: bifunctional phosphoribosylaminoimidazolecarboxamide formyltransferase/IMP cyclohydrolase [Melioribacteraceae bacterium]